MVLFSIASFWSITKGEEDSCDSNCRATAGEVVGRCFENYGRCDKAFNEQVCHAKCVTKFLFRRAYGHCYPLAPKLLFCMCEHDC